MSAFISSLSGPQFRASQRRLTKDGSCSWVERLGSPAVVSRSAGATRFPLLNAADRRKRNNKGSSAKQPRRERDKSSDVGSTKAEDPEKEAAIEMEGVIIESLPNAMFRVQLTNDIVILAHVSGRIRKNFVRCIVGDRVRVELSPYDLHRGRIVYRLK